MGRVCPQGHVVAGDNLRVVGRRNVCIACTNASATRSRRKLRDDTLEIYGGKCACCGETQDEFLTFDHVNNDGNEWRRQTGIRGSYAMCRWLRDNGWPTDYQILCFNCNIGKHINGGVCPHKAGDVHV